MSSGRTVIGGDTVEEEKYIAPTVIVDVSPSDPIMQEEVKEILHSSFLRFIRLYHFTINYSTCQNVFAKSVRLSFLHFSPDVFLNFFDQLKCLLVSGGKHSVYPKTRDYESANHH